MGKLWITHEMGHVSLVSRICRVSGCKRIMQGSFLEKAILSFPSQDMNTICTIVLYSDLAYIFYPPPIAILSREKDIIRWA